MKTPGTSSSGIMAVDFTGDRMSVDLADGCTICVPLAWYPRLLRASTEQRGN
jgi:hypothetical protein